MSAAIYPSAISVFSVKLAHSSPNKFPDPFMDSLQRPSEASRKDRGHRKSELLLHKGKTLLLQRQKQNCRKPLSSCRKCLSTWRSVFARSRHAPSQISASQDNPGSKSEKRCAQVSKSVGKRVTGATWTNPKEQRLPELLRRGERPGAVGKGWRRRESR